MSQLLWDLVFSVLLYINVKSSVLQSCNYFIEKHGWRFISMRIGRSCVANMA
ncbi:hypothetical protein ACB098_12G045100 [Castanea mollissima]